MSARTTPDPDLNTPATETLAQRVERDCENRSKHSRYMAEHEFERAVTDHVDHLRGQVEKLMTDRMTGPQVHDRKGGGRYVTIGQHHPLRPFTDNVTARLTALEKEVRGLTGRTEPVPDGYTMIPNGELAALRRKAHPAPATKRVPLHPPPTPDSIADLLSNARRRVINAEQSFREARANLEALEMEMAAMPSDVAERPSKKA